MPFKVCSFRSLTASSLSSLHSLTRFLNFFFCILSLPCHLWVHTADLKPTFYQAERASGKGPAVPKAAAVAVAMATQGLRTGCFSLSLLSPASVSYPSSLFFPSILSFKERVNRSDPVRGVQRTALWPLLHGLFLFF